MSARDAEPETPTAAALLVDALRDAGVTHMFANFGSDHPAIIEALARDRERSISTPRVIICPHEYSALSAAHAYAAVTGEAQAVFVHTDVGTANLGGAVHNAARSRAPVLIFAGLTPFTIEGELPGGRNTHVNHLQDTPDQHGLVRPYVKWSYDIRTAANVPQIVHRALQIARSAPAGPVYLTGARETLAERAPAPSVEAWRWGAIEPIPAPDAVIEELMSELMTARSPVIVTTYLGREPRSVGRLVELSERLGLPVVEVNAEVMSFPHDHPLHLGDDPHALIADADVVLAIDTDVPWIVTTARPSPDARVYVVNDDPLQERIPLWYVPADRFIRADSGVLLQQMLARSPARGTADAMRRADEARRRSASLRAAWQAETEEEIDAELLTAGSVAAVLGRLLRDDDVVVCEAISAAGDVWRNLPRRHPGTLFGNRGTSLGWSGGGALGVALAAPGRRVVSLVGDGTFFFSVPSSTYWIAERYRLAPLTVVLDNGGWNATKRNVLRQDRDGPAARGDAFWSALGQTADFGGIAAAAGGASSATVTEFGELEPALRDGLASIVAGRSAVVTVRLDPISRQPPE